MKRIPIVLPVTIEHFFAVVVAYDGMIYPAHFVSSVLGLAGR
jgi:hypothetical protein